MKTTLNLALTYILADEGGFALRASEPGGACNMGISMLVLEEWRKRQNLPAPTTEDLRLMLVAEAKAIYTDEFAAGVRYYELPAGVDYALLNTAVMQGIHGAILLLQKALYFDHAESTGKLDTFTLATTMAARPEQLVADLLLEQAWVKMHDKNVEKHGSGWADRQKRVKFRAHPMCGAGLIPA